MAGLKMNQSLFPILVLKNLRTGKHSASPEVNVLFLTCNLLPVCMAERRVSTLLHLLCSDALRNEDMDGEWEAPRIPNPACEVGCGEWSPPMIDNPKYKGVWRPPMIDNPNYQVINTHSSPTVESKVLCYSTIYLVIDNVHFRKLACNSVPWLS